MTFPNDQALKYMSLWGHAYSDQAETHKGQQSRVNQEETDEVMRKSLGLEAHAYFLDSQEAKDKRS